MDSYFLFFLIALITVLSPGPGVILTLSNAVRFGLSGTVNGILGIALGTFVVASVSATSLGLLLATSAVAFSVMKFVGAAYLVYLGLKLWCSPRIAINEREITKKSRKLQFSEGLLLQLTNPKAVFFFMSVFPQFINFSASYLTQFSLLVTTYSCLVIIVHLAYAYIACTAREWLDTDKGGRYVNRLGGGTFICFGIGLASSHR